MENKKKEAVKSSVLMGVATGVLAGGVSYVGDGPHTLVCTLLFGLVGVVLGLLLTWDFGNADQS